MVIPADVQDKGKGDPEGSVIFFSSIIESGELDRLGRAMGRGKLDFVVEPVRPGRGFSAGIEMVPCFRR
ncbi:hypothetical protein ACFWY9_40460 [Amycolatopsis sp. NPDC059027]|uniref:hypothetical protein n=1 Tax=Amycolatopsis sp. NPDC059027 TaxID=3346709 RepID=UPI00366B7323